MIPAAAAAELPPLVPVSPAADRPPTMNHAAAAAEAEASMASFDHCHLMMRTINSEPQMRLGTRHKVTPTSHVQQTSDVCGFRVRRWSAGKGSCRCVEDARKFDGLNWAGIVRRKERQQHVLPNMPYQSRSDHGGPPTSKT